MNIKQKMEFVIKNCHRINRFEMAEKLGMKPDAISQWICRLRKKGIKLNIIRRKKK